ncbi:MAG: YbhB/YbcL family Raf kinase inhibitor-like protein [Rickettsiales bacterium]|nr:YbhB/YbcL family Raf kinase inhibitor-like protein [Rickettsiales bacterium]
MKPTLTGAALIAFMLAAATAVDAAPSISLSSRNITPGKPLANEQVYNSFGCTGKNLSPQLAWSNIPPGTRSLAITMFDPDAPTGSGWWHWVVFNIPVSTMTLQEGASGKTGAENMPAGAIESRTDFGTTGYGGPCPPPGRTHRYITTLWALNVDSLPLDKDASGAMVGFYLNQHKIASAAITTTFGR